MPGLRLFVGYGYNARDKWVETHVIPLVRAFGCKVEHGKAVYGGALPNEVLKLIHASDAMIGFTTRRDPDPGRPGQFPTHPWVVQELTAALSQVPPIPWVEVREEGVVSPGGMIEAMNTQRIDYREAERADCLLSIALALERFGKEVSVRRPHLPLPLPNSTRRHRTRNAADSGVADQGGPVRQASRHRGGGFGSPDDLRRWTLVAVFL